MPVEDFYWRGKPASELTREELVEMVKYLANQIQWYQDQHQGDERVLAGEQR